LQSPAPIHALSLHDALPILQFVLAVDDHDVARIQARAQADAIAGGLRNGDGANLHGVVVSGGIDVSSLGAALNRSRRNNGETARSEEHTSELQSPCNLVCRL